MPVKESITPQDVVNLLNEVLALDPKAMNSLMIQRVPCNPALAEHPSVQVGIDGGGGYCFGVLGLFNGLFGSYDEGEHKGWGTIVATVDYVCCDAIVDGDRCPKCGKMGDTKLRKFKTVTE